MRFNLYRIHHQFYTCDLHVNQGHEKHSQICDLVDDNTIHSLHKILGIFYCLVGTKQMMKKDAQIDVHKYTA